MHYEEKVRNQEWQGVLESVQITPPIRTGREKGSEVLGGTDS